MRTILKPRASRNDYTVAGVRVRLLSFVDARKVDECWEWQGHRNPQGYGLFNLHNKSQRAHRVSYILFVGHIQKINEFHGNCVLHRCDNPPCINPSHLFLGTNGDNVKDSVVKKRRHAQKKTHCSRGGHPLSGDNLFINPSGHRGCKECRRASDRRIYWKQKEQNALST